MTLCGCVKEAGVPTYAVTGTVTQKGKPVEGAIVAFTPRAAGPSASGVTDATSKLEAEVKQSGENKFDFPVD